MDTIKSVNYLGKPFNVPTWANYIAADANNHVHAYKDHPYYNLKTNLVVYVGNLLDSCTYVIQEISNT